MRLAPRFSTRGKKPKLQEGVLYNKETVPDSGHGQLIVGYDDTRGKVVTAKVEPVSYHGKIREPVLGHAASAKVTSAVVGPAGAAVTFADR